MSTAKAENNEAEEAPTPTERTCEEPGCETLLSRYNDREFCSLHAPMFVPRMRGKVL